MAWTDPADFTVNEIVTAAKLNSNLRDNMKVATHQESSATTAVDVNTTTRETVLFTYTLPANRMGTNRMLRLTLIGDYLYNNSTSDTVTLRTKFGSQTDTLTLSGLANSATRGQFQMLVYVGETGATNSQYVSSSIILDGPLNSNGNAETRLVDSAPAIVTTSTVVVTVSAQWSASSANDSFRMRFAALELVGG